MDLRELQKTYLDNLRKVTEDKLERKNVAKEIRQAGFDITSTSKCLMDLYMELLK